MYFCICALSALNKLSSSFLELIVMHFEEGKSDGKRKVKCWSCFIVAYIEDIGLERV